MGSLLPISHDNSTTTTVSFICVRIDNNTASQKRRKHDDYINLVIRYNCSIDIYHNIHQIFQQTSQFWNNVTEWLKNLNLLPRDYTLKNITALGLRPEISHFALLINYCFLLARYHIWLAKTKENQPNLSHFIRTVKSQYEIEIKSGDKKKWKPLAGHMRI